MIDRAVISLLIGVAFVLMVPLFDFDRYSDDARIEGVGLTRSKYATGIRHHIKSIVSDEYKGTFVRLDWLSIECHHVLVMHLNKLKRSGFPDRVSLIKPESSVEIFSFDHFRQVALHYQTNNEDFQRLSDQQKFEFNRLQTRLNHVHHISYYNPAWVTSNQWFYIEGNQLEKIFNEYDLSEIRFDFRGEQFGFGLDSQAAVDLRKFVSNVKCK